MAQIRISAEAAQELEEAAAWYENEQQGLGVRFIDAFENAIQLLREPNSPLVSVGGKAGSLGGKKLVLRKFPYSLVTFGQGQTITIVALAHHSRKPGYWVGRLDP